MTTTPLAQFVWNRSYDDYTQVEPYYPDYLKIHEELDANGTFPYNDLFKGRIDGVAGSPNEDTAIYMLQTLHSRKQDAAKAERFIADGAKPLSEFEAETVMRGDLARRGWYMGGTGWQILRDVRVIITTPNTARLADRSGRRVAGVQFKMPKQRQWRTHGLSVDHYYFRPSS